MIGHNGTRHTEHQEKIFNHDWSNWKNCLLSMPEAGLLSLVFVAEVYYEKD